MTLLRRANNIKLDIEKVGFGVRESALRNDERRNCQPGPQKRVMEIYFMTQVPYVSLMTRHNVII